MTNGKTALSVYSALIPEDILGSSLIGCDMTPHGLSDVRVWQTFFFLKDITNISFE